MKANTALLASVCVLNRQRSSRSHSRVAKKLSHMACRRHRRPNPSRGAHRPHDSGGRTRSRCIGRIQLIVATRSSLAYRATPETDPALPHCDTRRVQFDPGYHRKHVIWRRRFDDAGGPTWTSIAPCSVSPRTSRRCAPVPQAASWTRPARDALPEAGRLRGMVRFVSPRNAIWILDPERHPKPW
jgi:hypothetical protein